MHRVPAGHRFGGPEIALLFLALAFAVPLTAWWHGLYRDEGRAGPGIARTPVRIVLPVVREDGIRTFSAVGFMVDMASPQRDAFAPAVETGGLAMNMYRMPRLTDPNQTLLLGIAVIGTLMAGVYTLAVYPSLRR